MKYDEYLQTEYWQEVSKAVKAKAGWKCQICNSPHDLNAHHRTYEHRGNELEHLADLVCLFARSPCIVCNAFSGDLLILQGKCIAYDTLRSFASNSDNLRYVQTGAAA